MNKGIFYNRPEKYKYSSAFEVKVKPIVSEEKDKYLAVASQENLKKFLPKELNISDNIDLLSWAGNYCVANKINLNDDAISTKEAIEIVKLLPYKFVDLEHDRNIIFGCILTAGYSEYGTDKPLTEEEIKDYKKPFNITVGGIIWRVINPDFADAVEKLGTEESEAKISLSWELAFSEYDLILIDKDKTNIEDGQIISDASKKQELENKLRAYGGSGYVDNKKIARVIKDDVLPVGAGFVENPAGQVGQITTEKTQITASKKIMASCPECGEESENEEDDMMGEDEIECANCKKKSSGKKWSKAHNHYVKECSCGEIIEQCRCASKNKNKEILPNSCEKCKKTNSQAKEVDVKQNTDKNKQNTKNMSFNSIKDITDENIKEVKASDLYKIVDLEVSKIDEKYTKEKTELQNQIEAANKKSSEMEDKYKKVQEDLEKLVKANEAREQQEAFDARMGYFETNFTLEDKVRDSVAKRIKGLKEEDYLKEKEDLEVLLAASKKQKKAEETTASAKETTKETQGADVDGAIDKAEKEKAAVAATSTVTETPAQKAARVFGRTNWEIKK